MKKGLLPLILAGIVLLPGMSRDEDLWAAAGSKARAVAGLLEQSYFRPLEEEDLAVAAIKGTLDTLDPHSYFLDASSFSRMREDYSGKYYGVGLQIQKLGDNIVVIAPIEGGPAWRLGLLPGDIVSRINGESTVPISSYDAMQKLRGEKGTKVDITVVRDGVEKPLEMTIIREEIPLLSVPYAFLLDGGVGYIYIRNFGEETPRELEDALAKLTAQGLKSLVLDLRLNTGGGLAASVEISDLFLPRGSLIVSMKGRNPYFDKEFRAFADNQYEKLPLVILIDQGTASASEIVSGAVMDHDRGLVVGEDSWGKGLVQQLFPLAPNMAVALTVAKYLTPSGRSIQRDYRNLDDYLTSKRAPEASREISYTEHGRKVLGQGGITPDYAVDSLLKPVTGRLRLSGMFFAYARKLVQHQTDLGRRMVLPQEAREGAPAQAGKVRIGAAFVVNDEVMADFRKYLAGRKASYDAAAFKEAEPEIRREIEREVTGAIWGVDAGVKISRENDPAVLKAIEVMPEAARFLARD
ncbi:MAG TPA: S41 family peptidase [Candidatus Aminicenantes bacterium]|nr:S41 family peptidase [Candidatus Aminicenantes bacterium]HRY64279.1 S41 family peptidase [Candidatus Aminicenantes bacterium]HRZ71192.1 S41 family peptidase [Candidatus Aminicenantes bacterium]